MAPNNRHRRAIPRVISPPFPIAADAFILDSAGEHRWSNGGSLDPSHGYSALVGTLQLTRLIHQFTSGFLQNHMQRSSPSPEDEGMPEVIRGPFHPSPQRSPRKQLCVPSPSPTKTPARRHRSSIMHHTPMSASPRVFKSGGTDNGVERALDNVLRSLKVMAMGTGTPVRDSPLREQSRWSMSSEESGMTEESGPRRSRRSVESTRSRVTVGTVKSTRSLSRRSKKSRMSEDTESMDVDMEEHAPPMPTPAPVTPSRKKRMMEGLAKKLGLTPKKQLPPLPETEVLATPRLPRKSSMSTLRTLARKASTSTLRSVRSTKSSSHPFMGAGPTLDCEAIPPPIPSWPVAEVGQAYAPITPRRRNPKPNIGQPRLQRSTSPSSFLQEQPRRPPGPASYSDADVPPLPDMARNLPGQLRRAPSIPLHDKLRRADQRTQQDRTRCDTPELSPMNTSAHAHGTPHTVLSALVDTPRTQIGTPGGHEDACEILTFDALDAPPLTYRSAQEAFKPKRLLKLLPQSSRTKLGLQTPAPTSLRSKMSTISRPVLGDVTHRGINSPDDIPAFFAHSESSKHSFAAKHADIAGPPPGLVKGAARRDQPFVMDRRDVGAVLPNLALQADHEHVRVPPANSIGKTVESLGDAQHFGSRFSSRRHNGVPDFTLSPEASFVSLTRASSRESEISLDSREPTEQWELEACLGALERVDREREDAAEIGVGR